LAFGEGEGEGEGEAREDIPGLMRERERETLRMMAGEG
jgi:hypothetical protein